MYAGSPLNEELLFCFLMDRWIERLYIFSAAITAFIGTGFEKERGRPRFALDSSISLNDGSR